MAEVTAVIIPQDNVNDDAVMLLAWCVKHGDRVEADQVLIEIETSKTTMEITSPASGIVHIERPGESEVPVGSVLCFIGESIEAIQSFRAAGSSKAKPEAPAKPETPTKPTAPNVVVASEPACETADVTPGVAPSSTRFSRAALELMREHSLDESQFAGAGLIRTKEVLAKLFPASAAATSVVEPTSASTCQPLKPTPSPIRGAAGVPIRSEPMSRTKRLEAKLLAWSSQVALRSSVTTTLVTTRPNPTRHTSPDAAERLAAATIFECGRLLKKFPAVNAYCDGENFQFYERVNVGYALDAGSGLKVPVFRDADSKSIDDLLAERRQYITEYLEGRLKPESLASGTFTITDLSGSGVLLFDPLIVEAQAAILGIAADVSPPGSSSVAYNLTLSFDHRLIEGRVAARFVNELRERLLAHEEGPRDSAVTSERSCSRCGMTASAAASRKHFLVQVADQAPTATAWVCTNCLGGR